MSASASVLSGGGTGENSGVWKFVSGILAAVVITLLGCIATTNRDAVRKTDIDVLQRQLDQHTTQLDHVNSSLLDLHTSMGEVKGALGVKR